MSRYDLIIYGDETDETINGGVNDDYISAGSGNNIVFGDDGDDTLISWYGNDTLYGGDGNDILVGGSGTNNLTGGLGADRFIIENFAEENTITDFNINEGDVLEFDVSGGFQISYEDLTIEQAGNNTEITFTNTIGVGNKVILENVLASDVDSSYFVGLSQDVVLSSSKFDDLINIYDYNYYLSRGGSVEFYAGEGDDIIYSYDNDIIYGGAGNDVIYVSYGDHDLTGGLGNDTFSFTGVGYYQENSVVIRDFNVFEDKISLDRFEGVSSFDDLEIVDSVDGAILTLRTNDIWGYYENTEDLYVDVLLSGVTKSELSANNFIISDIIINDELGGVIEGSSQGNYVYISQGDSEVQNTVNTNEGDDVVIIDTGINAVNLGDGNDDIVAYGETFYGTNISGSDYYGGNGNDRISLRGDSDHEIYGEAGDDHIEAIVENSIIDGGRDDDYIVIDTFTPDSPISGNNAIFGGQGNDIIKILSGDGNVIHGGSGIDRFVFFDDRNFDLTTNTIADFEVGEKIDLQDFDISNFSDLAIYSDINSNVVIGMPGGQSIILENIDISQITANSFIFRSQGSEFDDVVVDNYGDSTLLGGAGVDIFEINKSANSYKYIEDFEIDSGEKIRIKNFYEIQSFNDIVVDFKINSDQFYEEVYNVYDQKYDAKINLGDDQFLIIKNIEIGALNSSHFEFIYNNQAPEVMDSMQMPESLRASNKQIIELSTIFSDVEGDDLTYQINQTNGEELPGWVKYEEQKQQLVIYPPYGETRSINVTITAIDEAGGQTSYDFNLTTEGNLMKGQSGVSNDIVGGNDSDKIVSYNEDDTLNGGAGNDIIRGRGGADIIDGGEGERDFASYWGSESITINLLEGTASGGEAEGDVLTNIEAIKGSINDDNITGDNNNNVLDGNRGSDILNGLAGDDRLLGGDGDDEIYGGTGNDNISGGEGADIIDGGEGRDRAIYNKSDAAVTINLETNSNSGGEAEGDILTNIEEVTGSDFADNITMDDNRNVVRAGEGDDVVDAKGGNDKIYGNLGADILTGGAGKDQFTYNFLSDSTDSETDFILDFVQGEDKIRFNSRIEFDSISSGEGSATSDTELEYYFDGEGNTIIQSIDQEFQIKLQGEIALAETDFMF